MPTSAPTITIAKAFDHQELVQTPLEDWSRAAWTLQLAALGFLNADPDYSTKLITVATKMTVVTWRNTHHGRGMTLRTPRGGTALVGTTCLEAAKRVLAHDIVVDGHSCETLATSLTVDGERLTHWAEIG